MKRSKQPSNRTATKVGKPARAQRREQTYGDVEDELARTLKSDWDEIAEDLSKPIRPAMVWDQLSSTINFDDFDFPSRPLRPEHLTAAVEKSTSSAIPGHTAAKARREALQQLVADAAKWLTPQLREDSKADDFKDACLEKFPGLSPSAYDRKVLPATRLLKGWPAKASRGAKRRAKSKPKPNTKPAAKRPR